MKHKALVHILMALWALCAVRVAYAATFTQELRVFDYESLMWAAIAGLLGGALRTIFTLANDNRVVYSILKESRKDLVVALMAGALAYLLLIAIASKYPDLITREIRMLVIIGAGWSRASIFKRLDQIVSSKLDSVNQKARDGAPIEPPSSAAVPLSEK